MFRRRFHQAGLARFTYKVSSLKMMDLSSLFLPIAFGFLPIAFVLFLKKRAQNPKPRQIRNFPYKTPCFCVHDGLKSAVFCRLRQKWRPSFAEFTVSCKTNKIADEMAGILNLRYPVLVRVLANVKDFAGCLDDRIPNAQSSWLCRL